MRRGHVLFTCIVMILLIGSGVAAHDGHDDAGHGTAATPGMLGTGTALIYLELRNDGDVADRLLAGSTDVARVIEMHDATMADGMMRMRPATDGLAIEPGATVTLAPGGAHIMLVDLTRDLRAGDRFEVRLTFAEAGDVIVPVVVGTGPDPANAPVTTGELTISGVWSRPAPMLSPLATPAATPEHHGH